jgi:hypothetical protein
LLPGDNCTTTGSFTDHGVTDGSDLILQTYYRLLDDGVAQFSPTEEFFDHLVDSFRRIYLLSAEEGAVPDHVAAAIDDARVWTAKEYADEPEADLREEVLPTFYQQAAAFHCQYRE